MRILVSLVVVALLLIVGFYALNTYIYNEKQADMTIPQEQELAASVVPVEHASGVLEWGDTTVYFDPTGGAEAYRGQKAADIVLVTDIHGDHLSTSTLASVVGDAVLVVPQAVRDQLPEALATSSTMLANGESSVQRGITITAIPMYNLPDADNSTFHQKGRGNGYLLEKDGFRVYIAGDTAGTPEMRAMQDIDIALVPMNMPYTMTVEEAADAVLAFKPRVVYPYHFRGQDGFSDVNRFQELVNAGDTSISVVIADWYPES